MLKSNKQLLLDIWYTREQELIEAEKKLVWVRMWIELLTSKIVKIENQILDGNNSGKLHVRVDLLNIKLSRLKLKMKLDVDRILYISSSRHTTTWADVDYINSQENKFILNHDFEKLTAIRLITITENSIFVSWSMFDRFDINSEDWSKVLSLGHSLTIGI